MLAGTTSAVNLTDGLDGLAAGCAAIVLLAYIAITFTTRQFDLALVASCLVGACVGFLWFNSFPASIFMGDTGSLGLGGAIAGLAVMTKTEVLLIILGGIFVIEALSVLIQVASFQAFRKRVFLMAPIHHHFELRAWSETKIILRFWIVAAVCSAIGFTLYQQSLTASSCGRANPADWSTAVTGRNDVTLSAQLSTRHEITRAGSGARADSRRSLAPVRTRRRRRASGAAWTRAGDPMDPDRLDEIVAAIPSGRWMSYGDVARAAGGTDRHARALNQRFIRAETPGAHRVLKSDGTHRRHRARRPGGGPPPARVRGPRVRGRPRRPGRPRPSRRRPSAAARRRRGAPPGAA